MKASWVNILEDATVTVTSQTTGYDSYRLYDRQFGRMWKASSTATQTIHLDRGSGTLTAIDALIIPAGHNLSGCGMTFERSANNSSWTPIVTGWTEPSGALEIRKQGAATNTDRYLRVVISGASVAPQAAECWIGRLYEFTSGLSFDTEVGLEPVSVTVESLYSKATHTLRLGTEKTRLDGQVKSIVAGERSTFEDWFLECAARPFYFVDHLGDGYFARFVEQPRFSEKSELYSSCTLPIQQVF